MDAPGSGRRCRRPDPVLGLDQLTGSPRRRFGALAFLVLGAGLLAGCGGATPASTSARVLTAPDLGPGLALTANHSNTAVNLGKALTQVYPGCPGHFAVFTDGGRTPTSESAGGPTFPEVFSEASACASVAKASSVFARAARDVEVPKVGGRALSGLADAAVVAQIHTADVHEYALFWRNGSVLGFVQVSGPANDTSISAAQIKVLAKREIARQSAPGS